MRANGQKLLALGVGRRLWSSLCGNPGLRLGVLWNLGLLLLTVAALPFDRRQILGLSPWIKPLKFEISVVIYLLTVGLVLDGLGEASRWRRSRFWIAWGTGVSMIVENSIIALQSARGVRSHMNFATLHDTLLFAVMGLFIALNTVLAGWLLALWCAPQATHAAVVSWGVRLGLIFLLAGSLEGVRMVVHGGHTVGAIDGGPGLPFVNWSRQHGDLRVPHFFALHALQVLPLLGLGLARLRWRASAQVSALFAFAAVYGIALCWAFAEALRGYPIRL